MTRTGTADARRGLRRSNRLARRPTVRRRATDGLRAPYPFELHGRCAGCGQDDVDLRRVYGPLVFRYRCVTCLPKEPHMPPRVETSCMHALVKFDKPLPAPEGRPWLYHCLHCEARFKIATGMVL